MKSSQGKFNPFYHKVPYLYTLKTTENFWFSDVFREYRNRILGESWLKSQIIAINVNWVKVAKLGSVLTPLK